MSLTLAQQAVVYKCAEAAGIDRENELSEMLQALELVDHVWDLDEEQWQDFLVAIVRYARGDFDEEKA